MKKILFMLSSMNIGGVEKSLLSLLSSIPQDKYDITVLLLEKNGAFLKLIPDWVKIEETLWFKSVKPIIMQPPQETIKNFYLSKQYKEIPSFISRYFLSKYLDMRYAYYRQVFEKVPDYPESFDIAISYQGPTDAIDYYIANKVSAKKKITWVHFDVNKHRINTRLYSKLYKHFNEIFVVSNDAKKSLVEKLPSIQSKTKVFLNIVSPQTIKEMAKKPVEFDKDFMGLKILTVGRLSIEKGQDIAIRVLSRLRKEGYNVRWYCVGEGKNRKAYDELIAKLELENDFILLGAKSNPYPYIASSDLYVQTSKHEGYCLTLAEAKCLAKPIVTTDFSGASEQIINGYNGLIAENEEELYEKVKYLIDNPEKRKKLSGNLLRSLAISNQEAVNIL